MTQTPSSRADWETRLLLAACTTLALVSLPHTDLPPAWLLAFVLPGAIIARAAHVTPRAWQRALFAAALQTLACWLALESVGPMSRPAALACTILPPLGFATARANEADQALSLFLAFCVVLVGTILGGASAPLLGAFTVCACLCLRCADHTATLAQGRRVASATHRSEGGAIGGTLPLVFASLLAVLVVDHGLRLLPSPSRGRDANAPAATAGTGPREIGLDDAFSLDNGGGMLGDGDAQELVRAHAVGDTEVPNDLYLRSTFFTVPGLDRWLLGPLSVRNLDAQRRLELRARHPAAPTLQLAIERIGPGRAYLFVPPAVKELLDAPALTLDREREWLRPRLTTDGKPYRVIAELLRAPLPDEPVAGAHGEELLQLPRDLDLPRYRRLLQDAGVPREPTAAMAAIRSLLARRCRYERSEPTGPFANAIDNFLFAPDDRHGYCMHFASAAALLLRVHGVPCRIAIGVYGGEAMNGARLSRSFGSQHAHAWVEVPFADRGYTVFDPTPPDERGHRTPTLHAFGNDEAPATTPPANDAGELAHTAGELVTRPEVLLLALLLALGASLWPRRASGARPAPGAAMAADARRLLGQLLRALAAAGEPRQRGQTLEGFARTLAARGRLSPPIDAAFAAYQRVRFGGRPFDAEHERLLRDGLTAASALAVAPPAVS